MKRIFIPTIIILLLCINIFAADNECDYLAKAIASEMGGEPFVVRVMYGEMLLNRVAHENYPDTLPSVCFSLGIKTRGVNATQSDKRAAAAALCGFGFSCGALNVKKVNKNSTPLSNLYGVLLYGYYFY